MASPRVTPMIPSKLTGVVKEVNDAIKSIYVKVFGPPHDPVITYMGPPASGDRSETVLYGPVQASLHNPSMAKPILDVLLGLGQLQISPNARETVLLVTAAAFGCTYVRYAHERIAMAAPCSLTKEQVRSLSQGKKPEGQDKLDERCDLAFDIATELCGQDGRKSRLSQELWDRAVGQLGKDGTLEVVHYGGVYAWMCMLMNACDVPLPEGETFV